MAVEPFSDQFLDSVRKALSAFKQLGAQWMFIGAVPVATWGRVRATTDADFAVSLELTAAPDLDRLMKESGLEKVSGPVEIPAKRLILSKYWSPYRSGGIGIDVFFTTGYDTGKFLAAALARKVPVALRGETFWAATAEDLVVLKILAFRARDLDDVAGVLERRFGELDWRHIRAWSAELRIENLLRQVVEEYLKEAGRDERLPWET